MLEKGLYNRYVSEIDQFLTEFDNSHPDKSPAQQYEINKYARVNRLRDNAELTIEKKDVWQDF